MTRPVDIIVPVYRGERETRACLESVLGAATRIAREIVVIDDRSPEPAISAWIGSLAREGRVTLLSHATNRGFVASVNEGMALHPDRDVVLLNSDTEVAPGWLDRLYAAGQREPRTATVTPFSNNATICSYPRTLQGNPLPPGETTATLDAACAVANAGRSATIPTAVGFCMHIRREALVAIGAFDEARYGAGYGEEVDFCMRAARAGLRNLIAADVFVRHVGEVSFGSGGSERRARAQAIVDELYPEFQQGLREFIPADPLRMLRRRVDLERLRRGPREGLVVEDVAPRHARLRWAHEGEELELWIPRGSRGLAAVLRTLREGAEVPQLDASWLVAPDPAGGAPGWLARLRARFC